MQTGRKKSLLSQKTLGQACLRRGICSHLILLPRFYVDSLYPGDPAEKAGLQIGDVLVSFDGKPINALGDLRSEDLKAQDSVVFNILREQEAKTITVYPTENATLGFMVKPKFDFNTTHVDLDLDQSITEGFYLWILDLTRLCRTIQIYIH